jgi:hypothetical protein
MVNYYAIRSSLRTCIEPIDLGVVPVPGRDVAVLQMAARPLLLQVPLRLHGTHARTHTESRTLSTRQTTTQNNLGRNKKYRVMKRPHDKTITAPAAVEATNLS